MGRGKLKWRGDKLLKLDDEVYTYIRCSLFKANIAKLEAMC